MLSCEKVWVEDLQEKAYDTIRGHYEIESILWEEDEPIDINGDGEATFDYLAEWNRIVSGGTMGWGMVYNDRGTLSIPYVIDQAADWGGYPSLYRRDEEYSFKIEAVIEGNDSHLKFELPDREAEFVHSGYGEITLRTDVSLTVLAEPGKTKEVTGTILIKYIRTKYRTE